MIDYSEKYNAVERIALSHLVQAIAEVARASRTFTVQHVRERLAANGHNADAALYRRLTWTALCIASNKERRNPPLCHRTREYVPSGDETRTSRSARLVWASCSA